MAPSPKPAPPPRLGEPGAYLAGPIPRPMTLTLLSVLWFLMALASSVGTAVGLNQLRGAWAVVVGVAGPFLTALGLAMTYGVFVRSPWARTAQLVLAGAGIIVCPLSLAAIATLVYMMRPEVAIHFSGRQDYRHLSPEEVERLGRDQAELPFTLAILGGLFLGLVLTGLALLLAQPYLKASARDEGAATERLVAASQARVRERTACGSHADLEGQAPATLIPDDRADGPSFLRRGVDAEEVPGYSLKRSLSSRRGRPASGPDGRAA